MLHSLHFISIKNQSRSASKAPKPVGLYPHVLCLPLNGNLLFLSGLDPEPRVRTLTTVVLPTTFDHNGEIFWRFDFAGSVSLVASNVRACWRPQEVKWENLVDVTVFLVNMRRFHAPHHNRVYAEYFRGLALPDNSRD
ncbi:MAG: Rid family hydrolase [Flavobacteriales bacterium]